MKCVLCLWTAPAAQTETVAVCLACFCLLTGIKREKDKTNWKRLSCLHPLWLFVKCVPEFPCDTNIPVPCRLVESLLHYRFLMRLVHARFQLCTACLTYMTILLFSLVCMLEVLCTWFWLYSSGFVFNHVMQVPFLATSFFALSMFQVFFVVFVLWGFPCVNYILLRPSALRYALELYKSTALSLYVCMYIWGYLCRTFQDSHSGSKLRLQIIYIYFFFT